jgi:hypothetical protein
VPKAVSIYFYFGGNNQSQQPKVKNFSSVLIINS